MAPVQRAFTLVELLVVIAVVAILSAVLFPVFSGVKQASLRTSCISNYKQLSVATGLYVSDYDDYFMPVNHQPAFAPNSRNDRTWVQLVLPYVQDFRVFICPADKSLRPKPEATFDRDLVPGDTFSQFYSASLRSNAAYNYLYLSPVMRVGAEWKAWPKSTTEIADPSSTLVFVDSVWSRSAQGLPNGGGSWLVVPPCRYLAVGNQRLDTFTNTAPNATELFVPGESQGWTVNEPASPTVFGGAWPWHDGRMTIAYADGRVSNARPDDLSKGCQVRENWQGVIHNPQQYIWDLR